MNRIIVLMMFVTGFVGLLSGCKTQIHPSGQINQPPQAAFNAFSNIHLNKTTIPAKYAGQPANEKAVIKIDLLLTEKIKKIYPELNNPAVSGRTLIVEPEIIDIKFVGGGARVWAGAMAGSSAVLMKVKFIEKETGNVIAFPEFYSKSSAAAGAYSFGGNDNAMLHRVASDVAEYISTYREQTAK